MKPEKTLHDHAIAIENRSFIGIILLFIPRFFPHPVLSLVLLIAGLGLLISTLLYSRRHYKCPHCGVPLPITRKVSPNFCYECGKKLEKDSGLSS